MSMRLLVVLLIGGLAAGNVQALAVSAPLSVDSPPADPHEDLFASRPKSPTSAVDPPPAPRAAERPPTPAAAQRAPSDNPLWAIPLGRLTASRERPLFAPTRRPPPPAPVAMPAPAPVAPPPRPVEPDKPQLSLLGTIVGGEKIGLFLDSVSKAVVRLKAGENHKGWILRDVRPHQVELGRGLDSAVLNIARPDMKAGGTPVATTQVAPVPAAPAVIPASAPPVYPAASPHVHPAANLNLPVNTARAAGAQPPGTPAGAPGIQLPTSKLPPSPVSPPGNR